MYSSKMRWLNVNSDAGAQVDYGYDSVLLSYTMTYSSSSIHMFIETTCLLKYLVFLVFRPMLSVETNRLSIFEKQFFLHNLKGEST